MNRVPLCPVWCAVLRGEKRSSSDQSAFIQLSLCVAIMPCLRKGLCSFHPSLIIPPHVASVKSCQWMTRDVPSSCSTTTVTSLGGSAVMSGTRAHPYLCSVFLTMSLFVSISLIYSIYFSLHWITFNYKCIYRKLNLCFLDFSLKCIS